MTLAHGIWNETVKTSARLSRSFTLARSLSVPLNYICPRRWDTRRKNYQLTSERKNIIVYLPDRQTIIKSSNVISFLTNVHADPRTSLALILLRRKTRWEYHWWMVSWARDEKTIGIDEESSALDNRWNSILIRSLLVSARTKTNGGNYSMPVPSETITTMPRVNELFGNDLPVPILFPWRNCRYEKLHCAMESSPLMWDEYSSMCRRLFIFASSLHNRDYVNRLSLVADTLTWSRSTRALSVSLSFLSFLAVDQDDKGKYRTQRWSYDNSNNDYLTSIDHQSNCSTACQ